MTASVAVGAGLRLPAGGVVVQPLRHQVLRQRVLLPGGLFNLGPLVLEPDFDLRLVEAELQGQVLPPLLGEVAVLLELRFQPLQLLGTEGRPGPLVLLARGRGFLWFAGSGPLRGKKRTKQQNIQLARFQTLLKAFVI